MPTRERRLRRAHPKVVRQAQETRDLAIAQIKATLAKQRRAEGKPPLNAPALEKAAQDYFDRYSPLTFRPV